MENYNYEPKKERYGKRVYIGNYQGEELFLKPINWDCGWYWGGVYLEGLRATTEEKQREYAYDVELSDYYNVENVPWQYLDEDRFKQDMEDSWEERADVQERQERNGEEVLLCFGCHTHTDSVLLDECKGNYKKALKVFDKLFLNEEQFKRLIDILKRFYSKKKFGRTNKKYLKEMEEQENILKEYEEFINPLKELPTEEYWTDTE